jgi:hypothetical protein
VGELAAAADALRRAQRQAQANERRAREAAWLAADEPLRLLEDEADLLARAALVAAGYRQHDRGEWRRRRHERGDDPLPDDGTAQS